tara:strand:- start:1251 stop:1457 length:207 start_codon:yes stop_codon:yes gene_type:complete
MSFILAVLSSLLIVFYIYIHDKFDKESKELILKSFLFGCLSVIPMSNKAIMIHQLDLQIKNKKDEVIC